MINPLGKCQEWARCVIGEKLSEVRGLIYVLDKPDFEYPQQLQLVFANIKKPVSFKCGKDGSNLDVTYFPIQENDLGEYGKEVVMDMSHFPLFVNYLDKILVEVNLIFSAVESSYIGLKLFFEGYLSLMIVNIGDEMNILESFPTSYEKDEGIEYHKL
ncbi:TMV resistance protein N-like [Erwinia rhapontici]|uniref:hypothetical protein n=1 Tax=Erwinia rhapontici TaxID=55212 RepID=UPI003D35BF6D